MGERLSVGCQRASQSLRAAQAPANHLRSLLHLLPHSPTSPFCVFSPFLYPPLALPLSLSLPSSLSLTHPFPSLALVLSLDVSPPSSLPCLPLVSSLLRVRPLHFPQYRVHPVAPCYKHATMLPAAAHPAYLSELSCYAVVTARTT